MEHILAEKKINKSKKQTKKPLKVDLKKETNIKDLEKKVEVLQDKHIRLKAEFENFRKRKNREISSLLQYDGENFIKDFLPVADDIGRLINSKKESNKNKNSFLEGINIIESKIQKLFENKSIESFGKEGDILDPDLHEAMLTQKVEKKKDNQVLEVFEKGYRYHDKVIRHAKVVVNKK